MKISDDAVHFLKNQSTVIVSTLTEKGEIHCSAKGIVGVVAEGKVFVIDLYRNRTYRNIKANPTVSITAINEHKFIGYTLQGKAKIVARKDIEEHIVKAWENKIIERISSRIIRSVQSGVKSQSHFEAELPHKPKYLIEIDVENIIDLSPPRRKKKK